MSTQEATRKRTSVKSTTHTSTKALSLGACPPKVKHQFLKYPLVVDWRLGKFAHSYTVGGKL